jgi:hypothetical protein
LEVVMPLTDKYPLAVAFIIGSRRQGDGTVMRVPIGTGFILNVPLTARAPDTYVEYVVTAAHVVMNGENTAVRIRTHGGYKDVEISDWLAHPRADVALARFHADKDMHLLNVPSHSLRWPHMPQEFHPDLGDRVYFLGLLSVPGSHQLVINNVPMVRSGTIGALNQQDIPVEWPDKTVKRLEAHLIDCRSHGGFSGSPCFFQYERPLAVQEGKRVSAELTYLLGLISGHFDDFTEPSLRGDLADVGSIQVRVNTGVGIVTPSERIVEVLEMPEFKDERERLKREAEAEPIETVTLDSVEDVAGFEQS